MADVFISYARANGDQARVISEALRALGCSVWRDDELPAHRDYADVIEEQLRAAKAVVVVWSAQAVKSQWVRAEADLARETGTLVQLRLDQAPLPLPFSRIQCADLQDWAGNPDAAGWKKVTDSIAALLVANAAAGSPQGALRAFAVEAPALPDKPSLAVMPFANLSGDPEQEYFADGMVEEITATLSRIKSVFVIGASSTLSYKGRAVSPQDVGRHLGVRYLLEGSVRRAGERVRIGLRLTEAADGAQRWADHFEDTLHDVFALQDRVALAVAGVIEPAVRKAEIERAGRKPVQNLGSYDLYLRALPLIWPVDQDRLMRARQLLERAIEHDEAFAPALGLLSHCYGFLVVFRWAGDAAVDFTSRGLELARRAVRAAPEDPAVLTWAGNAMMLLEPDWAEGAVFIERAVTLNPGDAAARFIHGRLELMRGEPERAIRDLEAARRLDPLSERIQAGTGQLIGMAKFYQGHFAEAVALLRTAEAEVGSPATLSYLAAALGLLGDTTSAAEALARVREKVGGAALPTIAAGRPEHRKMFEQGIALAESGSPNTADP